MLIVEELLNSHEDYYRYSVAKKTQENYKLCRKKIPERLLYREVDSISRKDAVALFANLCDEISPAYAALVIRYLSAAWAYGNRLEIARGNPWNVKECVSPKGIEGRKAWTLDEAKHFLAHTKPGWMRVAVVLGLDTAQRLGDVLRMRLSSTDGDIAIVQSKTGKILFMRLSAWAMSEVKKAYPKIKVGDVIVTSKNGPLSRRTATVMFRTHLDSIKLHGLSFHGLRKTSATLLLQGGATDAQLMARSGMSRTTVGIYTKTMNQQQLANEVSDVVASQFGEKNDDRGIQRRVARR